MLDYKIVRLSEENFKDLLNLYNNCFNMNETVEKLHLKYETGFTGIKFVGYLAYSEMGQPAAYYGVFPIYVLYEGKKILSAQSGDTMTHPDHRGKGLFIELAKQAYKLAEELGIKVVFGFPNKNSYHGFVNKLNWIHRQNMKCYKLEVKTIPLAKLTKKFKLLSSIYASFTFFIFKKYQSEKQCFDNSVLKKGDGGVEHNLAFFNYKAYSEKYLLKICGKCVWIKIDGALWIGDIEPCDKDIFLQIISKIKKLAKKIGANNILFHTSPGTALDELFSLVATSTESLAIGHLDINSGIDLSKMNYTSSDFDTF